MQCSRKYNALVTKTYAKTWLQLYSRMLEFAGVGSRNSCWSCSSGALGDQEQDCTTYQRWQTPLEKTYRKEKKIPVYYTRILIALPCLPKATWHPVVQKASSTCGFLSTEIQTNLPSPGCTCSSGLLEFGLESQMESVYSSWKDLWHFWNKDSSVLPVRK